MNDIHLIEKSALYRPVSNTPDEWTTGTWAMSAKTAETLVGGTVYLHTSQKAPCFLGGKILGYEPEPGGRYTLRFRFDPDVINTTTVNCKSNWSVEMLLEHTDL